MAKYWLLRQKARDVMRQSLRDVRRIVERADYLTPDSRLPPVGQIDKLLSLYKPYTPVEDDPVLLCCAGWRSGSTLVQRLITGAGRHLVWGEPYTHTATCRRLVESLACLNDHYPPKHQILDGDTLDGPATLADKWIANLHPEPRALFEAHRQFMRSLFAQPAAEAGFASWGIKEVRWSIEMAAYFRALFPRARIVLLVRSPYDAWASYREKAPDGFLLRWPDIRVRGPRRFGKFWVDTVDGFLRNESTLNALLIRHEDLTEGSVAIGRLEAYLGYRVYSPALRRRVGSSGSRNIPIYEKYLLKKEVQELAETLGY